MNQSKRFNSFNDAEDSIKTQVLNLCENYSLAIKKLLPVLKKATTSATNPNDVNQYQSYFDEGNDHLHNLVQLTIELKNISPENRGTILEISSEVLANTVKYLSDVPEKLSKTEFYQQTSPK